MSESRLNTFVDFLFWLWAFVKPYWTWVTVALVSMGFYALSSGGFLFLLHEVTREFFQGDIRERLTIQIPEIPFYLPEGSSVTVMEGDPMDILMAVIGLAVVFVLIEVFSELGNKVTMKTLALAVARDARKKLYNNILERPLSFFEQRNVGDLLSRTSSDINRLKSAVSSSFRNLLQGPLEAAAVIAVASYAAPSLSPAFLIIPVCALIVLWMGKRIKKYSRQSQDTMGDLLTLMQERFAGIKLVKAMRSEDSEQEYFDNQNERFFRRRRRQVVAKRLMKAMLHMIVYGAGVGLLLLGGLMVLQWEVLSPQGLIVFVVSLVWVYKPLRKVGGVYGDLQAARGAAERVEQIFEETRVQYSRLPEGDIPARYEESLLLDDVSYSYPRANEFALQDIDLRLNRGERVAFVGHSGAGKSTLIDLVMRFFDPTIGELRLDGSPVPEYDLRSFRSLFGLVTQHPILFDATVTENITYGRDNLTEADVEQAARRARAHGFIQNLPGGYDAMIGEKGVRLSGGEAQRVTLARALVGEPEILVLDEATSDVDSESEQAIIKAINNLPQRMSLITISHTLATVQFVDRIVVLRDGGIEATGTHEELLEDSPTYQILCEHQAITT